MKVAYICPYSWEHFHPDVTEDFDRTIWCASNNAALRFPQAVGRHGVDPVVFYFSASTDRTAAFTHRSGIPLRRMPIRFGAGRLGAEYSLELLRVLRAEDFDLFHYYNYYGTQWWPDMFDLFAAFCRRHRYPFVAHYQGGSFPGAHTRSRWKRQLYGPKRLLKRWALLQARRLMVISEAERQRLTGARPSGYGIRIPPAHLVSVSNIIDTALFAPGPRAAAREALGLDPRGKILFYVGFLREGKGVQHLLRVLPNILEAHPNTRLLVVGKGEYAEELRLLGQKQGVTQAVSFVGHVQNEDLAPYYRAADVHVLPSYREGMPSVVLEALACGTPTVATAVGGIPATLAGGLGLLVPPRDEAALRDAVLTILDGRFAPPTDAREARLREHSHDHVGRALYSLYEEILGRRSST